MLKIAHRVNNLSDARYFAAYDFDWIFFDFGNHPEQHKYTFEGILSWIEVENIGVCIHNTSDFSYYIENQSNIKAFWVNEDVEIPHGIIENYPLFSYQLLQIPKLGDYLIVTDYDQIPENLPPTIQVIMDIANTDVNQFVLDKTKINGIAIPGFEEERPGFKSFNDQDEWIDFLENY